MKAWVFIGIAVLLVLASEPAAAEKRVALVIGNSAYEHVSRLENPTNDANLIAATLRALGFALVGNGALTNLDKIQFDTAIQNFGNQMVGADVALFYYAGHGIQLRGANHLVPINANPTKEADVDFQMVDVAVVLHQMEGAGTKLNLVILDACRNDPFGGRGLRSSGGGLAQMNAPEGTLISYATQPGNVAQDGTDGDSPYTKALVQTIGRPGLGIFDVFNEVGLTVKRSTGGSQQPWVSSSPIDGSFYFVPQNLSSEQPRNSEKFGSSEAAQAWSAAKDTTNVAVLESFIQRYKGTFYADLARARLDDLRRSTNQQAASIQPSPDQKNNQPYGTVAPRQRALLYEEDPSDPKGKQFVGSVVWRTEPVKGSGGQPADIAVRADIEVPDRKFKMTMSFRRNTDSSLPASHTVELAFILPPDFAGGGVSNVPGILMKSNEQARGTPLAGLAVKVTDGFFLVGLSNVDADRSRNIQLLKERSWFDVPLVYANQRRVIIVIEKGSPGEQAFTAAILAWGERQPPPSWDDTTPPSNTGIGEPKGQVTSPSAAAVIPPLPVKRPQITQPANLASSPPSPAPSPAASPPAVASPAAGPLVLPRAIDPKYASMTPGQARMHSCVDQYVANKATNSNGGMKWIQMGGGYYSVCNQKLKD